MAKAILCLYDEFANVRNTIEELVEAGVAREDINIVARDDQGRYAARLEQLERSTGEDLPEDEEGGALAGGVIGGLAGLLVSLGVGMIPGIGPVIAAGPLATALIGAGAGSITGSLVGAIAAWGIPEEKAEYYAERMQEGRVLVCVRSSTVPADQVERILQRHQPVDVI